LSEIAVKTFRNGDKWDINSTPVTFWRGANLSDWMGLQSREVQLDKLGAAAYKGLSNAALATLYIKVNLTQVKACAISTIFLFCFVIFIFKK
jgi:hypothetical protein